MQKPSKKQKWEKKKKEADKRKKAKAEKEASPKLAPWQAPKMKMYSIPNPFAFMGKVPIEKQIEFAREMGTKANEEFKQKYLEAEKWFDEFDPLYILSYCMVNFTTTTEGTDPEIEGKLKFPLHLLEILQALALTRDYKHFPQPLYHRAEDLQKEMRALADVMLDRLGRLPDNVKTEDALLAYLVRSEMMTNTMVIRNWAYNHQMLRIILDLCGLIDEQFEKVHGARASTFVKVLSELSEQRNTLLNDYMKRISSIFKEQGYREILRAYNVAFPELPPTPEEEMEKIWKTVGEDRMVLLMTLLSHSEYLNLSSICSFTLDDVRKLTKDEGEATGIWSLFQKLTYKFGDLKGKEKEHFLLQNPVARKPFIEVGKETLFSVMWTVLLHNTLDIIEELVWPHLKLQDKYIQSKSKYLEDEVVKMFRKAFPSAKIYIGSQWDAATGDVYENDLTVVIDSFAIVVEDKSGTISDPARRGAPDRLFNTFKELVEEPSDQAHRFMKLLSENKQVHHFRTKRGETNEIDSTKIKYYVPIGVTFSHLGQIGSNLKRLIEAKIIDKPLEELAPSINFTELEIIFDLLESEAERVHYLARRREFEAHVRYQGDEIDLLAFYLDDGFNIGEDEYTRNAEFRLMMKRKELDPYIIGTSEGRNLPKPRLQMTDYWRDLLGYIQRRKPEGWLETCYVLLNIPTHLQAQFKTGFDNRVKQIRAGWTGPDIDPDENWILVYTDPQRRRFVVVGYPYTVRDKNLRNQGMNAVLMEETAASARGAVILGFDLGFEDYPYSVMARSLSTDLFDTLTLPEHGEDAETEDSPEAPSAENENPT